MDDTQGSYHAHVKSSASTERFIYLGIARAPANFRNSERRVPLHAAFDLHVERRRVLVSPLRSCSLGLRHAFAIPQLRLRTHGVRVTKILVQHPGHLETVPRIVSRHRYTCAGREFLFVKIKEINSILN